MDTALFKKLVRFYLIHTSCLRPGKSPTHGNQLQVVNSQVKQEIKCVLVTVAKGIATL